MKTLRLITNLCFFLLAGSAFSQGLQGIVVEKYYQANAADVAGQESGASVPLTTSSVTYRVFVDMAAGYKFNQIFAVPGQSLTVNTTTAFYNDPGYGVTTNPGTISTTNMAKKTTMLDSWFTTGGVVAGKSGVLKSADTDGAITNTNGLLTNNPGGCYGLPIQGSGAQDGYLPNGVSPNLTYAAPNALGGFSSLAVLDQTSGGSITITDGALAALGGIVGPTSSNMVLIGQFTTTGQLSFALNVQIQNISTGAAENYYANPTGSQLTHASLTLVPNTPPTVTLASSPSTSGIITNTAMTFTATATDANGGTVTGVQFFDNGTLLNGTVTQSGSTYTYAYTASVNGAHAITAKATDNDCAVTTSSAVNFTVAANQAPTVSSLTAPATAYLGSTVTLTCSAADVDGTVASVEFFVNSVSIGNGTLASGTYSKTYSIPTNVNGTYSVQAKATDNLGLVGSFATTSMNVVANTPPTVSLTNPTASQLISAPTVITLTATTADIDGIDSVNFFINNLFVGAGSLTSGSATNGTWTYAYTSTPGIKTFTAKAIDDFQAKTTSSAVTLDIADPNALPYKVKNVTQNCDQTTYLMPVAVSNTYTVDNVIGYDVVLTYDASKLTPTGNVFVANNLYSNAAHIETATSIGTPSGSNGTMQISLNFNGNAPASAEFNGTNADIFTVQFTKTSAFAGVDSATVAISSIQESYFTGVLNKTANSGKAYSIKNQNYPATLLFWSDNQAIKYNAANPNAFLITNVNGTVSTTGTATSASTSLTIPNTVTGVVAGMKVVADGIPASATVASVSGTTVTLSTATTAALAATPVAFVSATAVQPNTSGVFTHILTNGQQVRISRDISNNNSVQLLVNGADAVLGKTLLLNGNFTPSVYQVMALDVNLDGVVSAGDISQIKQRATLAIPEFRQAWNYNAQGVSNGHPSKDWVFVDQTTVANNAAYQISSTFPANDNVGYSKAKVPVTPFSINANVTNYATCPEVQSENYFGIMLGDVNASYATYTADGVLKSNGAVVLDLAAAKQEGNNFRIPVSFEATEVVNSLDFAVRFNNNMSYMEMVELDQAAEATSFMNTQDQTLRFSGFNVSDFATGANVAELVVATENGKLTEKDIIVDLAILNGKPVDMKFAKSTEAIQQSLNVQVYPNPNNGSFAVESVEGAFVAIYDMNGRMIAEQGQIPASGKLTVNLSKVNAGVYFVQVQNANFSTMKKVIVE
jgi:hypothetical protein